MPRILAIDYGAKRTGLAVTDPLQIIASPLEAIYTRDLVDHLKSYFKAEEVEEVIIGWPTQDDGSDTNNTPLVRKFISLFEKEFPGMPLKYQDEWGTSKEAKRTMIAGGMKKIARRNKFIVDKVSAALILQAYLDRRK